MNRRLRQHIAERTRAKIYQRRTAAFQLWRQTGVDIMPADMREYIRAAIDRWHNMSWFQPELL